MNKPIFTIALGADHAGFACKQAIKAMLEQAGHSIADVGTHSEASVDYPEYAHAVASAVEQQKADFGILCCGSANGMAITANKHQNIRAALCWTDVVAELARKHNNANIVCVPARFVSIAMALRIVHAFLDTGFEGGRHARRVAKIAC